MDPLRSRTRLRYATGFALAGIVFLSAGCRYVNRQEEVEAALAQDIIRGLKIYEVTSTNTAVTNLDQLLTLWYPYVAHQKLSRFGKYAGFRTSIVEKYTFFWPRLTHRELLGEVVCMS